MSDQPTLTPRDALKFISYRYDSGALAPGVFEAVKLLQIHLAWIQKVNQARERDRAAVRLG
jgi:hypothetical protein